MPAAIPTTGSGFTFFQAQDVVRHLLAAKVVLAYQHAKHPS